jgi:hypothetical protein
VEDTYYTPGAFSLQVGSHAQRRGAVLAVARRALVLVRLSLLSDVAAIYLGTRFAFLLVTYFGRALLHDPALVGPNHLGFSGYLLNDWFYRDSQWFLSIVNNGYTYHGAGRVASVAFFPAYPLLIKSLQLALGLAPDLGAMMIANLAFLGALIYMRKLAEHEFGPSVARRAVFYMAIFPTAFFSFAPYSESLFLLCSIASLYYMRTERWWLAGLFGGLACGTRVLGIFLAIPFAWEYLRRHHWNPRRFRLDVLAGALIPAAVVAYMVYLDGFTGDPLAFVHAEAGWFRESVPPWKVIITSLSDIPKAGAYHPYFQAHAIVENSLMLCVAAVLLAGIWLAPASLTLYGCSCLIFLLSAPIVTSDIPLTSMSRYLFAIAPMYPILARLGRWPVFDRIYVLLSVGSLALFSCMFVNHMWGA